jgi:hypothetical protein
MAAANAFASGARLSLLGPGDPAGTLYGAAESQAHSE